MSKYFFIVFLGGVFIMGLWTSCVPEQMAEKMVRLHDHPLSPIVLDPDTTILHVSDLLAQKHKIDSISCAQPLTWKQSADSSLLYIIPEGEPNMMFRIRLHVSKAYLDVPIVKSSKKAITISIPDEKYTSVAIAGDMNAWNALTGVFSFDGENWEWTSWLRPGSYGYQLELNGVRNLDPTNDQTRPNGLGGINSLLVVEGPDPNSAAFINAYWESDTLYLHSTVDETDYLAFYNNHEVPIQTSRGQHYLLQSDIVIDEDGVLRIFGFTEEHISNDIWIPFAEAGRIHKADQVDRTDPRAMSMYFLMVDRFYNGDSTNDRPTQDEDILPIANFFGGDLSGVRQKVSQGYLDSLSLNTLWLSPIPKNPEGAFGLWDKGGVRSKFSAYHGYWPVSFTEIDDRFGSARDLQRLTDLLHKKDKNILLDFVANHVHELHPVYQAHKDEGWATNLYLPDGRLNTERWDEYRLTTWFDTFLPSLKLERQDITEMLSDSALYWLEHYGVDGFRHDATKHIPLNFWRTMSQKSRALEAQQERKIFQIGETYGTADLISSYLAYGKLDAQFDFNIYDVIIQMITDKESNFSLLEEKLRQSWKYYGYHHAMGNMSGNQDKTRIMSLATGEVKTSEDSKLAGWTREIDLQTGEGFDKVALVHALNFAIPGIPVIYYGDEIGMPGGNDPDNRKMMRFEGLTEDERVLKNKVASLGNWRSIELPLIYGNSKILTAEGNAFALIRTFGQEAILFLANKGDRPLEFNLPLPFRKSTYAGQMNQQSVAIEGQYLAAELEPLSYEFIRLQNIQYE